MQYYLFEHYTQIYTYCQVICRKSYLFSQNLTFLLKNAASNTQSPFLPSRVPARFFGHFAQFRQENAKSRSLLFKKLYSDCIQQRNSFHSRWQKQYSRRQGRLKNRRLRLPASHRLQAVSFVHFSEQMRFYVPFVSLRPPAPSRNKQSR